MMDAEKVYLERVFAAIEQTLNADLPPGWRDLRAPRSREREAAAVLLRLAGLHKLDQMQEEVTAALARAEERRHDPEAGEKRFWEGLRELLVRLGDGRQDGPPLSLADLALWGDGSVRPLIDRVDRVFRGTVAVAGAVDDEALTGVARLVLRGTARRWLTQARKAERLSQSEEAREEVS